MVINLQELIEKTIDFIWIDGSEYIFQCHLHVLLTKVNRSENEFSRIYELTLEFLNTNKEGREFALEDVEQLNSVQLTAILSAAIGVISEVDEHPNL